MSRGTVKGLASPHPLGAMLPAIYQEEDPFALAFTSALDEVLAPVFATLDNLHAYVDPWTAPEDFLEWVAGWVGAEVDARAPEITRRAAVAHALTVHRMRGTVRGLVAALELLTGGQVEISDSGGVSWSTDPAAAAPGDPRPWVSVRVTARDRSVRRSSVEAALRAAKPAHVVHALEVVNP